MEKETKKVTVTDYEKKVKEVNNSMSSVLKQKRELEELHRKQEILINKIKKIDEDNKAAVAQLTKKKNEEQIKESAKFEKLVIDLDTQKGELVTKKENQPLSSGTYGAKKLFINSRGGQELMAQMNSQTLKSNAEELISKVDELLVEKKIMEVDPVTEYTDTADILKSTYSWSNPNGGGASEEPKEPVKGEEPKGEPAKEDPADDGPVKKG